MLNVLIYKQETKKKTGEKITTFHFGCLTSAAFIKDASTIQNF